MGIRLARARKSLVVRLVVSFLLPSLLILLLLAGVSYRRARTALEASVVARLDTVATVKQAALETWVDQLVEQVELLADLPDVVELSTAILDPAASRGSRDEAYARLSAHLDVFAARDSGFREIFLLSNPGGRVVYSTHREHEGTYHAYDNYYLRGRLETYVHNVYPSPESLEPTLTVVTPIGPPAGGSAGVLAAHLELSYLDEVILQETGLGANAAVSLVDAHKILVSGEHYGLADGIGGAASWGIDEVTERRDGHARYRSHRGAPVIGVYRWLDARELGLLVEVGAREALAPARQIATSTLSVGSVLVVALALGILLVARRIARPILAVTDAARRVAGGDLHASATVLSDDEIGNLARTFNLMISQLEASHDKMTNSILRLERAERAREELIEELEARNAELERFTYTVSHDLKSPLITIKGFLPLIAREARTGPPEKLDRYIERVSNAAERMHLLLEDLLELSRVGRLINPPEEIPLGDLAREAAEHVARGDGHSARLEVAPDLPAVWGDRVRLREVLENLVDNALKFSAGEERPLVEIGVRRDGGDEVFYVRDNGVGIEARYREKVFELFQRLDPAIEGTGVGLAIVRRVIEVHGGSIWVESEGRGRGATFCFTLPGRDRQRASA